jgi:hypothetical protein
VLANRRRHLPNLAEREAESLGPADQSQLGDWTMFPGGEDYLSRIQAQSHRALGRIRAFVLRVTREVLRWLEHDGRRSSHDVVSFDCR